LNAQGAAIPQVSVPSAVAAAALVSDWMVSSDILTLRVKPSVTFSYNPKETQDFWAYSFLPNSSYEYNGPGYSFQFLGTNYTVTYIGDSPIKKDLKINANFTIEHTGPSGKMLKKKFTITRQYPATKPTPQKLVQINQSIVFTVECASEVPLYQFFQTGPYLPLIRKCSCSAAKVECPIHVGGKKIGTTTSAKASSNTTTSSSTAANQSNIPSNNNNASSTSQAQQQQSNNSDRNYNDHGDSSVQPASVSETQPQQSIEQPSQHSISTAPPTLDNEAPRTPSLPPLQADFSINTNNNAPSYNIPSALLSPVPNLNSGVHAFPNTYYSAHIPSQLAEPKPNNIPQQQPQQQQYHNYMH
jgi:hypothetical protein